MLRPTKDYLFSENQVRLGAVFMTAGMIVALIALLLIATAQPRGRFERLDTTDFRAQVEAATADLGGYALLEDGRATIDIEQAMALVAQRGVAAIGIVKPGAAPTSAGTGDAADAGVGAPPAVAADGAAIYASVCSACHMANAAGIPGAFPPLAGHAAELYQANPTYPILAVTFGVMGQITVDGMAYNGLMPAHAHLSDDEIAAVLNHVMTSFGNEDVLGDAFAPYAPADVAAERGRMLSFTEVYALRSELGIE